jgi:FSR family fosmidomycin resistance protein-like MFS transporter
MVPVDAAALTILMSLSFCHLLNDMMQSLLPAMYPILKTSLNLDFGEIGLVTLVYQLTASLLQPLVGLWSDRKPRPYSLAVGMGFTLAGLALLSRSHGFVSLLVAAAAIGMGSSVFHPEASRVARMGPLVAAFIVLPFGQGSVGWFSLVALTGMVILARVGVWYSAQSSAMARSRRAAPPVETGLSRAHTILAIGILLTLIFSKYFYLASIQNYFTFYLIDKFHLSVQAAQIQLFLFLGAAAVGTIAGGPLGDRFGRKQVIWVSILGVLPFTLMLPYANLFWTGAFSMMTGVLLASAFPAIVVYAQELLPGKIGTVAGLFFGFAFGMGGLGAALLGELAEVTSIRFVYQICAFLPAIGLLTAFLPNIGQGKPGTKSA